LTPNTDPEGITAGPDGALWVSQAGAHAIVRVTPAGAIHEFKLPSATAEPGQIAVGPGNTIWFTEANRNRIGRVTLSPAP
jgi:virginiamycin B lyase